MKGIVTEAVSILKKATVSSAGEVKQTPEVPGVLNVDDIHVGHIIQVKFNYISFVVVKVIKGSLQMIKLKSYRKILNLVKKLTHYFII